MKPGFLRFLLASIVIIFHITSFVFIGTLAVYCFFILSGYWITFMYEKKYSKIQRSILVFYISRLLRVFPVFYLFTLLSFLLLYIYSPNNFDTSGVLFWFSNITIFGYNFLTYKPIVPAWSLDIELQFYIFFPLFLFIIEKMVSRVIFLITFFAIAVFLTSVYYSTELSKTLLLYLFYFVVGIEIYKRKARISNITEIIFISLFLLIVIMHYTIPQLSLLIKKEDYNRYFNQICALILIPLINNSVARKSGKTDKLLGDISYVLYLSHWVWLIPYSYYTTGLTSIKKLPALLLYLTVTYGMAYLFYDFYDRPIDDVRRKWLEKKMVNK